MINDCAIRLFIFKNILNNISTDYIEIVALIDETLRIKFLIYESILIKNQEGLVYKRNDQVYHVILKNNKTVLKCVFSDLSRRHSINRQMILDFMYYITTNSPFGYRLLKKNIWSFVVNSVEIDEYLMAMPLDIISEENKSESIGLDQEKPLQLQEFSKHREKTSLPHFNELSENFDIKEEITKLEIFENFKSDAKVIDKLFSILAFINNFIYNDLSGNLTASVLMNHFNDLKYDTELICNTHDFLIKKILTEINEVGLDTFLEKIISKTILIENNLEKETKICGNEIGMRGWRLKTRALLLEIYDKTKNNNILRFYNVLNKKPLYSCTDTNTIRIELMNFLIICYKSTKYYQDFIFKETRRVKTTELIFRNTISGEILFCFEQLQIVKQEILKSPANTVIGTLSGLQILLIGTVIYFLYGSKVYKPTRSFLQNLLKEYKPDDHHETSILAKLDTILQCIF